MRVCVGVAHQLFRYRIPLARPLSLGATTISVREGVLIRHADPNQGWGDASPLPGFSRETLDQVIESLESGAQSETPCPSVAFALSCIEHPIESPDEFELPINALVIGNIDEVIQQGQQVAEQGYQSVKLKVGRSTEIQDDISKVQELRRVLRSDQGLRLDANRAWTLQQAIEFAQGIADFDIEYIEEPIGCPSELERFAEVTQIPYALDETLVESDDLDAYPSAVAFVVKPTLVGGLERVKSLASTGRPLVFSSCFESGIGIRNIARWANHFSPDIPAGLDTYQWLQTDLLPRCFEVESGCLRIHSEDVDLSVLEAIGP